MLAVPGKPLGVRIARSGRAWPSSAKRTLGAAGAAAARGYVGLARPCGQAKEKLKGACFITADEFPSSPRRLHPGDLYVAS